LSTLKEYLQIIFKNTKYQVWNDIQKSTCEYFDVDLTELQEQIPDNLRDLIWKHPRGPAILFCRLKTMLQLNIQLSFLIKIYDDLSCGPESTTSFLEIPVSLGVRVKRLSVIPHAEGDVLKRIADEKKKKEVNKLKRVLKLAIEKFEEALDGYPTNKVTLRNCARMRETLLQLDVVHFDLSDPEVQYIDILYRDAISVDDKDTHSLFQYGNFLLKCGEIQRAEEAFLQAIKEDPSHVEALNVLAKMLKDYNYL